MNPEITPLGTIFLIGLTTSCIATPVCAGAIQIAWLGLSKYGGFDGFDKWGELTFHGATFGFHGGIFGAVIAIFLDSPWLSVVYTVAGLTIWTVAASLLICLICYLIHRYDNTSGLKNTASH